MDEATLRLVIVEGAQPSPSAPQNPQPTPPSSTPGSRPRQGGPPPLPFDPVAEAIKQREREIQRAQVKEAYDILFPKPQEPAAPKPGFVDVFLDVANTLRGTLGGIFGKFAGSILDVIQAFRNYKAPTPSGGGPTPPRPAAPTPSGGGPTPPRPAAPTPSGGGPIAPIGQAATAVGGGEEAAEVALEGAAMGAAEALGAAVPVIGAVVVAVVAAVKAFQALDEAIMKAADRYGGYSAEISLAQSLADVRTTLGDLRRAQEIGANLAEYINARSQVENKVEDIKVRFMNAILPIATTILDLINEVLDAEGTKVALDILRDIGDAIKTIRAIIKEIRDILPWGNAGADNQVNPNFDPFSIQFPEFAG